MSSFTAHSSRTAVVQRLDGSHRSVMDSSTLSLYTLWNDEADGSAHMLHRAASSNHHDYVFCETSSIAHLKPIRGPKWNLRTFNRIF